RWRSRSFGLRWHERYAGRYQHDPLVHPRHQGRRRRGRRTDHGDRSRHRRRPDRRLGAEHNIPDQVRARRRRDPAARRGQPGTARFERLQLVFPHHESRVIGRSAMKKLLTAFIAAGLATGVISVLGSDGSAYADAFTTGSVRGQVKDKASGEASVGATVVATSPALQGEQVVIADETGGYYITALPPGVYTITVYYNDTKYARDNVLVQLGKEVVVNVTVDTSATKGETIAISGNAPIVDQGSTKVGATITS